MVFPYTFSVIATSGSVSESMLILAESISWLLFPFMLTFLLVFLVIFEYVLGAFAEITHFATATFTPTGGTRPTGWSSRASGTCPSTRSCGGMCTARARKAGAMVIKFLVSAVGHEIVMASITKKIRGYGFVRQMLQLPIVMLQQTKWVRERETVNNVCFWCSMIMGLSLAVQSVHAMHPSDMDKRDAQVLEAEDGTKVAVAKADYSGAREKTDPKEIALVRKLDRWIMPMLWSMYWLNYLDRNAIALARLNDLEEDLNLTGTQYQTCVSILFVGYILGQVPSNMFLTRTRPSRYMGIMMMLWAIVSGLTAVSRNFVGLLLTRFFLGVTEAPYYPGAVYLLSIFYTRKEVATRIAVLYTGNILATAFAGLIAAGIYHGLDDVAGVAGWRWLFILQGAVTFVVAVVGFFLLPDFPRTTWWLKQEERDLAYSRMELDTAGNEGETGAVKGLKQAVKDPVVWVFAFMAHMHLAANGFKNFSLTPFFLPLQFPSVVETLNFNTTVTLVLTCPPYLIAGAVTILVSWSSGRFNERTWHITASKAVAVVGFVAAAAAAPGDVAGRYAAMVIFTIGTYGVNSLILGWCGSVCAQTKEKKAAAIGLVTTLMNCSFVWTPYLWPKSGAPRYVLAMASSAAFSIATAALAWLAKVIMLRRNRKLRESEDVSIFYVY
ncbi:ATP-dependent DNA helicase PIF1 [Purpureocillium lavendulum]|uniref:ATP-dependent DNA helicase PIF1 n=1 Tax=Purpureocillium lavendulum TaxID=1247861 RepID=A0AB34FCH2_9HYPO|nr:ATP-dependent DNA helicase PIF1 [Purpureocillium lavendulum]